MSYNYEEARVKWKELRSDIGDFMNRVDGAIEHLGDLEESYGKGYHDGSAAAWELATEIDKLYFEEVADAFFDGDMEKTCHQNLYEVIGSYEVAAEKMKAYKAKKTEEKKNDVLKIGDEVINKLNGERYLIFDVNYDVKVATGYNFASGISMYDTYNTKVKTGRSFPSLAETIRGLQKIAALKE